MEVDSVFDTYAAFEEKLNTFCQENNVVFTKRSSEKIKDPNLAHLKYEYIVLCCKQGVSRHAKSSTGHRKSQASFKVGCQAKIKLVAKRSPGRLQITMSTLEHTGHDVSKEMYRLYPENRQVEFNSATQLLMSCTTIQPSEVRHILEQQHDVVLLPRDIYNIKSKLNKSSADATETEGIINSITQAGGSVAYGLTESGEFKYLSYMTYDMISLLSQYPEVLIMDFTYKTNKYLYPLLTVMVIDGEGRGIPVLHGFVKNEDKESVSFCLELLLKNSNCSLFKCFVVDKDMAEIAAINELFPNVPVNLCHFHINQAVQRFLLRHVASEQVQPILGVFMTQVFTESCDEFLKLMQDMKNTLPDIVVNYFESNWWSKAHLWAASSNADVLRLHATTTNHLESYHSKIKKTLNHYLSFSAALRSLISFDNSKNTVCDRLRLLAANSVHYTSSDIDESVNNIESVATSFAATLLLNQLKLSRSVSYSVVPHTAELFSVSYKECTFSTSSVHCNCSFAKQMALPCRHIFLVRRHLNLPEFSVQLLPTRFNKNSVPRVIPSTANGSLSSKVVVGNSNFKTQEGRFNHARRICMELANFMAMQGEKDFEEKISFLESTLRLWRSPENVEELESIQNAVDTLPTVDAVDTLPTVDAVDTLPTVDAVDTLPTVDAVDTLPTVYAVDSLLTVDAVDTLPTVDAVDTLPTVDAVDTLDVCEIQHLDLGEPQPSFSSVNFDKIRPKGRPKAKQHFTRKRKRILPQPFSKLSLNCQKKLILSALVVEHSDVQIPIGRRDVKHLSDICDTIVDDAVDINIVKSSFTDDAWSYVHELLLELKANHVFRCAACQEFDDGLLKMVSCERCLCWFHFACVGFSSKMKVQNWFCKDCWKDS